MKWPIGTVAGFALLAMAAVPAGAQDPDAAAELAKKLANPIAALISVPLQYNYDSGYGLDEEGSVSRFNFQPVIPLSMSTNWNVITRTIVPFVDQTDIPVAGQGESGLGDVTASQFFSPKSPTSSGWIWGAGPVELLPTASDATLGSEKWGLGPTVVALKQIRTWTVGGLANHIWSVGGEEERADINATFLQPFLSYITKTKTTFGINTEATYDWEAEAWSVPVNLSIAQLLKAGPQIFQLTVGARYWADAPESGPEGWGARVALTLLYPK